METRTIDPTWTRYNCPGCGLTIYADTPNKRTMHQVPLCDWYTKLTSKATCEGEIRLKDPTK